MTREGFDRLVRQVEEGVGRNHGDLRRRTVWLAVIGYAGLLASFIVVLLISAGFFSMVFWGDEKEEKVIGLIAGLIVLGAGGWASLRFVLLPVAPPKGRVLTRRETPRLFEALDELRARLGSSSFHTVLLTSEFNAGVIQSPRLGLLGWQRNHLLLGLPLLDALSSDEMRAVLAHECVHLSRQHGRLSHRLYRLRRSWEELFKTYARPSVRGAFSRRSLTARFIDWFWPRFNAHAFVLSRADEYEADAQAAQLAGARHLASSLVRLRILGRLAGEKFWPGLWQLANRQPVPPPDIFARLRDGLRDGVHPDKRDQWLTEAFQETSTNSDTHPCLSERIHALKLAATPASGTAVAASPSAADILLGPALAALRSDVQELWVKNMADSWRECHARASALSDRLSSIEQAVPDASANIESLWDKAHACLHLRDNTTAEGLLREILLRRPDHAPANYQLGRLDLESGRPEGEARLERAMAANEDFVNEACGLLHEHYRQQGRTDRLQELAIRLDRHEKALVASRAERNSIAAKDTLLPHDLAQSELETLNRLLAAEHELDSAILMRKELKHFTHQRLFLLCIRRRSGWLANAEKDRALIHRLAQNVRLPGRVLVFTPTGSHRALGKKLLQTGPRIFERGFKRS